MSALQDEILLPDEVILWLQMKQEPAEDIAENIAGEFVVHEENQEPRAGAKRSANGSEDSPSKKLRILQYVRPAQDIEPVASTSKSAVQQHPTSTLYEQLQQLNQHGGLIPNNDMFDCEICSCVIDVGVGVLFRECLHQCCFDCAKNTILSSNSAEIPCPFSDGVAKCNSLILDSEIRAILSTDEYETYTKRSLLIAESNIAGSVHCMTPGCDNWCIVEDNVDLFNCCKCNAANYIPPQMRKTQNMQPVASTSNMNNVKREPSTSLYEQLQELSERRGCIPNNQIFDCEICFCTIGVGDGIRLRECLHQCCLDCAKNTILFSDFAEIPCPIGDGVTNCDSFLLDSEIQAILSADEYETFTKRSLRIAEGNITGSVHCKLPDCDGWCIVEDNVTAFNCPKCNSFNCIPCRALHPGINCKQYQDMATLDVSTKKYLETQIKTGKAMKCPKCQIIIVKRDGCDGVMCVMCRTELCWATKQARWGPKGHGDRTGGCGCNPALGRKCHPKCKNCH